MDPKPAELAQMTSMDTIADWAELPGTATEASSPRGALFAVAGILGTAHPRAVGAMSLADWQALINLWRYGDPPAAPSPAALVQAGLIGRAARILCGTQLSLNEEVERKKAEDAAALALAQAQAMVNQAPPSASSSSHKIKLSHIVNQTNEDEVDMIGETELSASYTKYKSVMGDYPPEHKECTAEQLSGSLIFRLSW